MKKLTAFSCAFLLFFYLCITSCTPTESDKPVDSKSGAITAKTGSGSVTWLSGTGGSHPDTLLVNYLARDCTNAPIKIMLVSDSIGGSHPDTTMIENVMLKSHTK